MMTDQRPASTGREDAAAGEATARTAAAGRVAALRAVAVLGAMVLVVVGAVTVLVAAGAGGSGDDADEAPIPATAVAAYTEASAAAGQLVDGCVVRPSILAAIGRVESVHGTIYGADVQPDGTVAPPIIGIALDGQGPVAAIRDTDDGVMDGDTTWDRAVGPMQFIPTSWRLFGVDGNGDGAADPHNLFDAAAAAVVHLCRAAPTNLDGDPDALRTAILSYNRSETYLADVLSFVAVYDLVLGDGTGPPATGGSTPPQALPSHPGSTGTPGAVRDPHPGSWTPVSSPS